MQSCETGQVNLLKTYKEKPISLNVEQNSWEFGQRNAPGAGRLMLLKSLFLAF